MAARILGELGGDVAALTLVPSGGGRFEIEVDGELLYSKLQTGSFPDEDAFVQSLSRR